ncbi:MAG: PIN domain-containing protein, partial [Pseudomonadota bacterium]
GPEEEARARGDAALLRAAFPGGEVEAPEAREAALWSPDPTDAHVIAAAEAAGAAAILTFNIRDFPLKALRPLGLDRLHPDEFLAKAFDEDQDRLAAALAPLAATATERDMRFRAFLKRASLPRLGKAWERAADA